MKALKNHKNYNKYGFTLIEITIYIAIIGGLFTVLVSFVLSISSSRNKSYAQQEVNANARIILSEISRKIKSANGINYSSSTFDVHPGAISLSMTSSTLNPTIINLDSSGRLIIRQGFGDPLYVSSQRVAITNLIFTNLANDANHENIGINIGFAFFSSSSLDYSFAGSLQTAVSLRE